MLIYSDVLEIFGRSSFQRLVRFLTPGEVSSNNGGDAPIPVIDLIVTLIGRITHSYLRISSSFLGEHKLRTRDASAGILGARIFCPIVCVRRHKIDKTRERLGGVAFLRSAYQGKEKCGHCGAYQPIPGHSKLLSVGQLQPHILLFSNIGMPF